MRSGDITSEEYTRCLRDLGGEYYSVDHSKTLLRNNFDDLIDGINTAERGVGLLAPVLGIVGAVKILSKILEDEDDTPIGE